jgi:Calcineurin-like phosphoesterase
MKALRRSRLTPTRFVALLVAVLVALVAAASASPAPPARLSISGGSFSVQAGQNSAPYTVTLSNGVGPATVLLSSTSNTAAFSPSTVTIPNGGTTATFTYSDTTAGSPTITAQANGGFKGKASASKQVTVNAGPTAQIGISPKNATTDTNGQQQYTATGKDLYGNGTGNVTGGTSFSISPSGGSCSANTCSASTSGAYTVTANYQGYTDTSSLTVTDPPPPTCQLSGPTGGGYTLNVCVAPGSGSTVHGNVGVTATINVSGTDPHTAKMIFNLDGQYLLTDFQYSSYTHSTNSATYVYNFLLPSASWVDASHTLQAQAIERDGFTSATTSVALTFSNGVTQVPPPPTGFTPTAGTNPSPGAPFVLAAVGDGAGGEFGATDVTNMIASWNPNLFLYLGDVYEKGSSAEFLNWYGTSGGAFFGQFDPITDPTVGNHEYTKGQAPGYFSYWRTPPNYYSFNTHGWHIVSLNSNLDGSTGSAQYQWLSNDLQSNTQACTLAYFHHPLFNIGAEPVPSRFTAIWPLLAQHGVDLVLNGHDHDYQRWVPMDGTGTPNASGPTEFVVGTGGHSLQSFVSSDPRVAYSLAGSFGALQLDLNPGGASYQYITTGGGTVDSGTVACNANGTDTTPPSTPTNLGATTVAQTSISPGLVNLTWNPSTDNVAVASYKILRDGNLIGTVGPQTSFSDNTVAPNTTYGYQVQAVDWKGNPSGLSTTLSVTTPAAAPVFSDGFESGDLSNWDTVSSGLTVESTDAFDGTYAAESVGTGDANTGYAWKTLPSTLTNAYYELHFKVVSDSTNVELLRFRSAIGAPSGSANAILGAFVSSSTGKLGVRDDFAATNVSTSGPFVADGNWHTLQVHVNIATGQVDTWLDGNVVPILSGTGFNLGPDPVGIIQLGENSPSRTYDVRYDDVAVDTVQLP